MIRENLKSFSLEIKNKRKMFTGIQMFTGILNDDCWQKKLVKPYQCSTFFNHVHRHVSVGK